MADAGQRFIGLRRAVTVGTAVVIAAGIVLLIMGLTRFGEDAGGAMLFVAGGVMLVFSAIVANAAITGLFKIEATTHRLHNVLMECNAALTAQGDSLAMIAQNSQVSDATRSVLNRQKERDLYRQAIEEDTAKGDYEAALFLIEEMEQRFGLTQEAQKLREGIQSQHVTSMQVKLDEAIKHIEQLFQQHEWARAESEIERLLKLLPNAEQAKQLPERLKQSQEKYKNKLLKEWDRAVKRNDIDLAIDLLRELDQYVSADEARRLEESARDVFKAKLLQLGVKFRFAAQEQRWQDALEVGLQIVEEFPNSRMATEVQNKMAVLRERAGIDTAPDVIEQKTQGQNNTS